MIDPVMSEKVLVALVLSGVGGVGTVMWFAVRKFFVLRSEAEAQRQADLSRAEEARRMAIAEAEEERGKLISASQKLADTVDKLTDRVVALELRVNALPTEAMLHNLNVTITALAATQQGQQAQLEGISRALERIQQYLLEHK